MAEVPVKRRLAAILAGDVVGYSRLMGEDEAGTLATLKSRRKNVLEPIVARHHGRIFKVTGDGVLVEFASALNAVHCAVELQESMVAANTDLPESRQIVLRIGINLGDVMVEGGDLYGDGVNIASRLEALAKPGDLCIAANVYDVVRGKLALSAEDLGDVELKNIAQPIRAFRVAVNEGPARFPRGGAQPDNTLSIAVLPFDNMSGIPEHDYIGEGIAENILTDLSRFRDVAVIARNSSFAYKGKATRVQEIRRDLGVNYILEGSVQKSSDRIRVTAQLIEGASGKHLWAERYDRRADDLFAVMDEITELIVGILGTTYGGRLRIAASEVAARAGPTSFRAFDHFVQGMQEFNKFTKPSVASALVHFAKAIEINPRYAKAHAKITWAHLVNLNFGWSTDEAYSCERARAAADAAVKADDAEAWAQWALAGCAMFDGQHDRALTCMQRAIELNPNDADILTDMGYFCAFTGKAEEGLAYALKALRINPHHPEYYVDQLGLIYFNARQYENAIRTLEGIRTLSTPSMHVYLAASHAALGHLQPAHAAVTKLLAIEPQSTVSYWTGPERAPYREKQDREHLAINLRLAGLPE
jgi:adenylate cyclase